MNEDELAEIAERGYEGMVLLTVEERDALLALAASAIEDFRRRAIEAVRALDRSGKLITWDEFIKVLEALPATENNTNE